MKTNNNILNCSLTIFILFLLSNNIQNKKVSNNSTILNNNKLNKKNKINNNLNDSNTQTAKFALRLFKAPDEDEIFNEIPEELVKEPVKEPVKKPRIIDETISTDSYIPNSNTNTTDLSNSITSKRVDQPSIQTSDISITPIIPTTEPNTQVIETTIQPTTQVTKDPSSSIFGKRVNQDSTPITDINTPKTDNTDIQAIQPTVFPSIPTTVQPTVQSTDPSSSIFGKRIKAQSSISNTSNLQQNKKTIDKYEKFVYSEIVHINDLQSTAEKSASILLTKVNIPKTKAIKIHAYIPKVTTNNSQCVVQLRLEDKSIGKLGFLDDASVRISNSFHLNSIVRNIENRDYKIFIDVITEKNCILEGGDVYIDIEGYNCD